MKNKTKFLKNKVNMLCVDSQTMKYSDKITIESGISSVQLMYRAAERIFESHNFCGKIYIICGKGNNGGDGLALAEIMREKGLSSTVFLIDENISNDSVYYLEILKSGVNSRKFDEQNLNKSHIVEKIDNIIDINKINEDCNCKINCKQAAVNIKNICECDYDADIIVDCIFGVGFHGELSKKNCDIIDKINDSKAYTISIDIPSGLNSDSGICQCAVIADKTIAIQCPKVGCYLGSGKDYCGQIVTIDIGITIVGEKIQVIGEKKIVNLEIKYNKNITENNSKLKSSNFENEYIKNKIEYNGKKKIVEEISDAEIFYKNADCINNMNENFQGNIINDLIQVFPRRASNTNKASYGKSLIIGGCANYLGAIKLANLGLSALRVGAGLNMIATAGSLSHSFLAEQILESTIFPLQEDNGNIVFNQAQIEQCLRGVSSVAFGMGIGDNHIESLKILKFILENYAINVLIDADGLTTLSKDISILNNTMCNVILTPHPKEMSRLCGVDMIEVLKNPFEIASEFAEKYKVCLLLKGASTLICDRISNKSNLNENINAQCNIENNIKFKIENSKDSKTDNNKDSKIENSKDSKIDNNKDSQTESNTENNAYHNAIVVNGTAALAKGGSGDTLSGVILGLMSQGNTPYLSAKVGAFLCAESAKRAAEEHSEYGVIASDVSKVIGKIVKNFYNC